MATTCWVNCFF